MLHLDCAHYATSADIKPDNIMLAISRELIEEELADQEEIPLEKSISHAGKEIIRAPSMPITYPIPQGDLLSSETWRHVQAKIADFGVCAFASCLPVAFSLTFW